MTIFLDMDGVLCDWTSGVHRTLGIPFDPREWPYKKGVEGWNFHDEIGFSFQQVNELCTFDLWATLDWTWYGRDILRRVLEVVGKEDIRLLTAPMPNVMSASGKVEWIRRNLPEYEKQWIVTPASKATFARVPDSILIDDSERNVREWREAGGTSLLVPAWWNGMHHYADDPAGVVGSDLQEFMRHFAELKNAD